MTRFKVALIHLLLSIVVIGIFVFVVYNIWYPKPLATIAQVLSPLKLLILIDVVIGPLLTFIVFKKTKPINALKLDLSIIVLLQISALCYGIYTIYNGKSSIVVFQDGQFYYLAEKYSNNNELNYKELKPGFLSKPKLAYIPKQNSKGLYDDYANFVPLVDQKIMLSSGLSVLNMKAKFKGKNDAISFLAKRYAKDDILFFTLNKDLSKYYVVYSLTQNRIIDQLDF